MNMKISVIIPVYNVAPYLRRCLDSVLNQKYTDIELILIDDGSTDESGAICDEYKMRDKRIIVMHKSNGGLSDARNAGLNIASGEYICFIDSDDWVDSSMFQDMIEAIECYQAQIACCGFIRTDGKSEFGNWNYGATHCVNAEQALRDIMKRWPENVVVWNKMYRAELFDDVRFPVGEVHEDNATFYKVIGTTDRFLYIDGQYYYYYQRPDSIMGQGYSRMRTETIYKNLDGLEEYLSIHYPRLMSDFRTYAAGIEGNILINYLWLDGTVHSDDYKAMRSRFKGKFVLFIQSKIVSRNYKIKMFLLYCGLFEFTKRLYQRIKSNN